MRRILVATLSLGMLSGCGLMDMASEARANLNKTGNAVHLQVLTVALQQMLAPVNTETLTPPVRMFPYGNTFSKEATAHEITETFHTFLVDVKQGGQTEKSNPTAEDMRLKSRKISLAAGGVIASFVPHEKLETIIEEQIYRGGRYEDTAYVLLLTRYTYLRDFFFVSVVDKSERVNLDSVRKAAEYFTEIKYIAQLSFVDRIKLHVPQFIPVVNETNPEAAENAFMDLDITVSPTEYKLLARRALRRFEREPALKDQLYNTEEGQRLLAIFKAE
ncbi:hypothetical protein EBR03_01525 [bacterium]|nr:hypothetical protein [bacterium]NBW98230.1 hypothetical protein [bacterium]